MNLIRARHIASESCHCYTPRHALLLWHLRRALCECLIVNRAMATLIDFILKTEFRPLALIKTLQTITIQTADKVERFQPLVSFLECEMKAGQSGIGFKRSIIVRSTFQKDRAKIGEVVDEEVSITVLPPRVTVKNAGGEFQLVWSKSQYLCACNSVRCWNRLMT